MSKDKKPQEEPKQMTDEERNKERGDSRQLIGHITAKRADGTVVPMLDEEGNEIVGIAGY